jgi:hypothetical protein
MPPSTSKRPSRQSADGAGKRPPDRSARPGRHSLRFYYSESLHARTLAVLEAVEQAEDCTRHREALSGIVLALASTGMDYYYLRPLRLAKAGPLLSRSARMGINGVLWVMAPVIRSVIGRMNRDQLLAVCTHIRDLME